MDGDACLALEEFPDVFDIAVKTVDDEGLSDDDVVLGVEKMATGDRDSSAGDLCLTEVGDPKVFDLVGEKTTGDCSDLVGDVGAAVDEAIDREKP